MKLCVILFYVRWCNKMKYGYIRPVTINDTVTEQAKKIEIYTKNILKAVSYTHLTLPTICSV